MVTGSAADGPISPPIICEMPITRRAMSGTIKVMMINAGLLSVLANSWRKIKNDLFMVPPRHLQEYFVERRCSDFKTIDDDAAAHQRFQDLPGSGFSVEDQLDVVPAGALFGDARYFSRVSLIVPPD